MMQQRTECVRLYMVQLRAKTRLKLFSGSLLLILVYLIARARFVSDARQILLRRIQRASNDSLRKKKKDTIRVTSVQGKILSFTLSSSEKTSSELDFEI